jgi:hypothetical protein
MPERIVFTLTTIPGRYEQLYKTLKSLHFQTLKADSIYLAVPKICARLNQSYPSLPDKIRKLCTVVRIEKDYGPITKLIGALLKETDLNTIIVSVDDDRIYESNLLEEIVKKIRRFPKIAIGAAGFRIGSFPFYLMGARTHRYNPLLEWFAPDFDLNGGTVDILAGYAGIAYRRSFFPEPKQLKSKLLNYVFSNRDLFKNDDVLISAYLDSVGIERRIFRLPDNISLFSTNGLADDIPKFIKSCSLAIQKCTQLRLFKTRCDVTPIRTATGGILAIILLIFIIIIAILIPR